MSKLLKITILATLALACTEQRDLYQNSSPQLVITGDWQPSLGWTNVQNHATAMLYKSEGGVQRSFFQSSDRTSTKVSKGAYNILVFNGFMISDGEIDIDNVFLRGTDRAETFEAYAGEAEPDAQLPLAEGEYVASNEMQLLTSAWEQVLIENEVGYYLKYRDGRNGYETPADYVERELRLVPRRISYHTQVLVRLVRPSSAANGYARAALRGFAQSVLMATGQPTLRRATHQLRLNNLVLDSVPADSADRGTISSPVFVSFGAPDGGEAWRYELQLRIGLRNGATFDTVFDLRQQVQPYIEKIRSKTLTDTILIEVAAELPDIRSAVELPPWEDDETIWVIVRE